MQKPIYINHQHEIIVSSFLQTILGSLQDITSNRNKINDFMSSLSVIIDYHNDYNKKTTKGNYIDFINIIPINSMSCVNGFLAGIINKRNKYKCRAYKVILNELTNKIVSDLEHIKLIAE